MNRNNFYENAAIEEEVLKASPHKLIRLLFEKCDNLLNCAKAKMTSKKNNEKCEEIIKAINIYEYLITCLNYHDKESEKLSLQLHELYSFSINELYLSYNENDKNKLDNAMNVLQTLKAAWLGIEGKV